MEKTFKYSGVNNGCVIASTIANSSEEDLMAKLYTDSVGCPLPLDKMIGTLFNGADVQLVQQFQKGHGDKIIINILWSIPMWKGHYAKIDGVWMCTKPLYKALSIIFFNQTVSDTKQYKDYSYIVTAIKTSTKSNWIKYTEMVNIIAKVNGCGVGRARTIMTMLVREGHITKHKLAATYRVDDVTAPAAPTIVARTFKYRPGRPPSEEEGYEDMMLTGTLKERVLRFIPAYCVDERVDNTVFYNIDNWIDKRIDCGDDGTPEEWVMALYCAGDNGWLEINWDNWTVRFYAERDFL